MSTQSNFEYSSYYLSGRQEDTWPNGCFLKLEATCSIRISNWVAGSQLLCQGTHQQEAGFSSGGSGFKSQHSDTDVASPTARWTTHPSTAPFLDHLTSQPAHSIHCQFTLPTQSSQLAHASTASSRASPEQPLTCLHRFTFSGLFYEQSHTHGLLWLATHIRARTEHSRAMLLNSKSLYGYTTVYPLIDFSLLNP